MAAEPSTAALELTSDSPERTAEIAAAIAARLTGGECLALDGELGAGKTHFVRALAEGLGVDVAEVSSPTFIIVQRHRGERLDLVHADAYRLHSALELEGTGWSDLCGAPGAVTALEWASKVPGAMPPDAVRIELAHAPGGSPLTRRLRLVDPEPRRADMWRSVLAPFEGASRCPICGRTLPPEAPDRPFCSPRCRSADLGRWLGERYRVSRSLAPDDLDER